MELFGLELKRVDSKAKLKTFELEQEAGVEQRISNDFSGAESYVYDMVVIPTDEVELLQKCRELSKTAEVDKGLTEIRNEIFIFDVPGRRAIDLSFLDDTSLTKQVKEKIITEYVNLYNIIDFHNKGLDYFNSWYIDGKLIFHKVVDTDNLKKGIRDIVKIEPINIRRIKEYITDNKTGLYDLNRVNEFFIYKEYQGNILKNINNTGYYTRGTSPLANTAFKINPDAITYIDSGIYDEQTGQALSFLYKSILPYNNLKLLEDASIIYTVTRAPSRRIFYIDTANLPKQKAESHVKTVMERYRTKIAYNSKTGTIVDKKNILSMVEDYWFPRQGDRTTEVQELDGAESLNTDLLDYYRKNLYGSFNVPISRLTDESTFNFGKSAEVDRDAYRFKKYIDRLRQRFVFIFEDLLKTQLLLKNIISHDEWGTVKRSLQWNYAEDNAIVEWKESEIMVNRIEQMVNAKDLIDEKYLSKRWCLKNIMKFSDEAIEKMEADIKAELSGSSSEKDSTSIDKNIETDEIPENINTYNNIDLLTELLKEDK